MIPENPGRRRGGKNPNGQGSVYQRADGLWIGAAYVLTSTGHRKRITVSSRTEKEAARKLREKITKSDRGIPVAAESWTVARFFAYWLEHVVRVKRPKTYQGYEGIVRRYVVPALGRRKLDRLTVQDVRSMLARLRHDCQCCAEGRDARREEPRCCAAGKCCGKVLSVRSVQYVHAVLRAGLRPPEVEQRQAADQLHRTSGALQKSFKLGQLSTHRSVQHVGPSSRLHTTYWVYHRAPTLTIMDCFDSTARHISGGLGLQHAMREDLLMRNVAKLVQVEAPRYRVDRGLTVDQAKQLLHHAEDDRLHSLYVLALYLGMRRAELLGLPWDAIDLDTGTLEVRQGLQRVKGELRLVPTKSRSSERPVPLPGVCVRALKAHRARQAAELLAAGVPDCGLVFTTTAGTPIEPDNLRRSWYPLRKRAGLGATRFHDLRHSCVTLLLDLGVPPHVVMRIVGHATLDVTMGIYAHAALDEQREALGKLERRLSG